MSRRPLRVIVVSDPHHASPEEAARRPILFDPIRNPFRRWLTRQYRRWFWLHDPFAHNYLLDQFLEKAGALQPDYVVANGDYSCDSAYIGVSDPAALASAKQCLKKLRDRFAPTFQATIGDHEIGKKMMAANEGGLRLASFQATQRDLQLDREWRVDLGRYVLIGVTSSLLALPVYEAECAPDEVPAWRQLRGEHFAQIDSWLNDLQPDQRILLFCHDPTALPYLAARPAMQKRLGQLERTIIGHLHSQFFVRASSLLSGMPEIGFLGHTTRRLSSALRRARDWRPFQPLLCPSLTGLQVFQDGGFVSIELDPAARAPAQFASHRLEWSTASHR